MSGESKQDAPRAGVTASAQMSNQPCSRCAPLVHRGILEGIERAVGNLQREVASLRLPPPIIVEASRAGGPAAGVAAALGILCHESTDLPNFAVRRLALRIRAHLHHLTAENARLAGEVEKLKAAGAAKLSTIHALCDDEERLSLQARLSALEWIYREGHRFMEINGNLHAILAYEIVRLERLLHAAPDGEDK